MDLKSIAPSSVTLVIAGYTLHALRARDVAPLTDRFPDFFACLTGAGLPLEYQNAALAAAADKPGDADLEKVFDDLPHGTHFGAMQWLIRKSWPPFDDAASLPRNSLTESSAKAESATSTENSQQPSSG